MNYKRIIKIRVGKQNYLFDFNPSWERLREVVKMELSGSPQYAPAIGALIAAVESQRLAWTSPVRDVMPDVGLLLQTVYMSDRVGLQHEVSV